MANRHIKIWNVIANAEVKFKSCKWNHKKAECERCGHKQINRLNSLYHFENQLEIYIFH